MPTPTPASPTRAVSLAVIGVLLFTLVAGALVTYKAARALRAIQHARAVHALSPKAELIASAHLPAWARPVAATGNYFAWVMVALGFGVLLGAVVRALFPERWLTRIFTAAGARGQLLGAALGAPLMLCSCCVAPLFDGVYARTRRLGPSLALMMAAPALNPAAIVLTFLLFPARLAGWRVGLSLALVLVVSAGVGRLDVDAASPSTCMVSAQQWTWRAIARALGRALREVAGRTLPAILVGVVASAVLLQIAPLPSLHALPGGWVTLVVVAAAVAVPLAMPTFGEIPIALTLLGAGAPAGAALAVLVAGPAINLPSLLTVRRSVSGRVAGALGLAVFAVAAVGGLLVGG